MLLCIYIRARGIRPVAAVQYSEGNGDVEGGGEMGGETGSDKEYPMVLLQIPMCNEREVRRCRFLPIVLLLLSMNLSDLIH